MNNPTQGLFTISANMLNKTSIGIIGAGFSGLASASLLARTGHDVHIFEKNESVGGRARSFEHDGFRFDMGPSWYWMPDVFDRFFKLMGTDVGDHYELVKLDPGFQIIFDDKLPMRIPASWEGLKSLFEEYEPGSSTSLEKFMDQAKRKYEVGMNTMVYRPSHTPLEFVDRKVMGGFMDLQLFTSFRKHVARYFKNPKLRYLMEFPILFLGAPPQNTPALYSLMNYSGLVQGTFYPMGGFGSVIQALKNVAESQGVHIHTSNPVSEIQTSNKKAVHIEANGHSMDVDALIAAADYHHVESDLLPQAKRNYSEGYWNKRSFAPSSLIFYLGIDKKLPKLEHHNLFFDDYMDQHADDIYKDPKWPDHPQFYACVPSKTDPGVAPEGKENLFILMPLAPGLEDSEQLRERYYQKLIARLENYTGTPIKDQVSFRRSYCIQDFKEDYNAYKGNAYGLANTLRQTAFLKPKLRNRHLENLFYAGQLTVPGPGVPPSLISGQLAANEINKYLS